jgi:hypothetical protein
MGLIWMITIASFLAWVIGVGFLGHVGWYIHVPLVVTAIGLATIVLRKRPRVARSRAG